MSWCDANIYLQNFLLYFRSEQDKEPEPEAVSEVAGPGPSEESGADGIKLNFDAGICFLSNMLCLIIEAMIIY